MSGHSRPTDAATLEREGHVLVDAGPSPGVIATLRRLAGGASGATGRGGRRLSLGALPSAVLELPARRSWAELVEQAVHGPPRIVRALLFDKSPDARRRVGWHRDTVVPLAEAEAVGGFTAPSVKAGQPHARAPRSVLERMPAPRLHLDDADEINGCLLVVPGSHADEDTPVPPPPARVRACPAQAGQALLMRPLLQHASAKPVVDARRRVLHLDLVGPEALPGGLRRPEASDVHQLDI